MHHGPAGIDAQDEPAAGQDGRRGGLLGHQHRVADRELQRGSTADLSFQVLKGDYSPAEVPDSLNAFDDRAIDIAADGAFELRFGPAAPRRGYFRLGAGSSMLLVREAYSDWTAERRGTIAIRRADRAGCAPPATADPDARARKYTVAGKILLSRLRTFLAWQRLTRDLTPEPGARTEQALGQVPRAAIMPT